MVQRKIGRDGYIRVMICMELVAWWREKDEKRKWVCAWGYKM